MMFFSWFKKKNYMWKCQCLSNASSAAYEAVNHGHQAYIVVGRDNRKSLTELHAQAVYKRHEDKKAAWGH